MRYDAILIDADDTVFDFRQAEKNAIGEVLEWLGMRGDDPQKVSDRFVGALSRQSVLLPGALGSVRAIAEKLPVAVVTNGIAKVQHGRMDRSPLKEWISAMIVSEEAGCQKPDPRMIFSALEALGGVAPGVHGLCVQTAAATLGDVARDLLCGARAVVGQQRREEMRAGALGDEEVLVHLEVAQLRRERGPAYGLYSFHGVRPFRAHAPEIVVPGTRIARIVMT